LKKIILISLLINFAISEDFISEFEYGQMLYQAPRGVSCASCHGKLGERTFIASFKEGNKTKEFFSPDIRNLNLKEFKKALDRGGKIMPRYYLTNKEIEAIYKYIKTVNSERENKKDNNLTDDNSDEFLTDDINITQDINSSNDLDNNKSGDSEENSSIILKIFKSPDENDNNEDEEQ